MQPFFEVWIIAELNAIVQTMLQFQKLEKYQLPPLFKCCGDMCNKLLSRLRTAGYSSEDVQVDYYTGFWATEISQAYRQRSLQTASVVDYGHHWIRFAWGDKPEQIIEVDPTYIQFVYTSGEYTFSYSDSVDAVTRYKKIIDHRERAGKYYDAWDNELNPMQMSGRQERPQSYDGLPPSEEASRLRSLAAAEAEGQAVAAEAAAAAAEAEEAAKVAAAEEAAAAIAVEKRVAAAAAAKGAPASSTWLLLLLPTAAIVILAISVARRV
jgi:hypothetical protein